jgi:hypothetical protein
MVQTLNFSLEELIHSITQEIKWQQLKQPRSNRHQIFDFNGGIDFKSCYDSYIVDWWQKVTSQIMLTCFSWLVLNYLSFSCLPSCYAKVRAYIHKKLNLNHECLENPNLNNKTRIKSISPSSMKAYRYVIEDAVSLNPHKKKSICPKDWTISIVLDEDICCAWRWGYIGRATRQLGDWHVTNIEWIIIKIVDMRTKHVSIRTRGLHGASLIR